jgi:hypothetical protein
MNEQYLIDGHKIDSTTSKKSDRKIELGARASHGATSTKIRQ